MTNLKSLPRLYTLKELVEAFGSSGVSVRSLRREIQAGRLRALRVRPGQTAKILIREDEVMRWLSQEAAVRQHM